MSETLSEALIKIPSLSPCTCMTMVEMISALQAKAKEEPDCEIKEQLLGYSRALDGVCFYSAIHQGVVLKAFSAMIKKMQKG